MMKTLAIVTGLVLAAMLVMAVSHNISNKRLDALEARVETLQLRATASDIRAMSLESNVVEAVVKLATADKALASGIQRQAVEFMTLGRVVQMDLGSKKFSRYTSQIVEDLMRKATTNEVR